MRILHLSTSDDQGGGARSSHRLHQALLDQGVDSHMLVQYRRFDDPRIHLPRSPLARTLSSWRPLLDEIPVARYRKRVPTYWSNAWFPSQLHKDIAALQPDLIHLHWVNRGFIPIDMLQRLNTPLAWTLHDSWPFTGGCHLPGDCTRYETGCGNCPLLRSNQAYDLSYRLLTKKQAAWAGIDLSIICPSRWMARRAASSLLFKNRPVTVIPNGIDLQAFTPQDPQQARKALNLPLDAPLILFGAMHALVDVNKGFDLLQQALQPTWNSPSPQLVFFGAPEDTDLPDLGMPSHHQGIVSDDQRLALLYAAADVVVVPSRQENLPNVAMEALACGTPVVGFDAGGLPDLVQQGQTGWLAKPYDVQALRQALETALNASGSNERRHAARSFAEKNYDPGILATAHIRQYRHQLGEASHD